MFGWVMLVGGCAAPQPACPPARELARTDGPEAAPARLTRAQELALARALRDGQGRARDRHAALGHYLAAAARPLQLPHSSDAQREDRELAQTAAYELALLLKQLQPEASDDYLYWMQRAGIRGLATLADEQPFEKYAGGFALQAVASHDGSERDRLVAERAAFLAAEALERAATGARSPLAVRWLYSRAGEAGARRLRSLPPVVRAVNSGVAPSSLGPREFSRGIDANAVATQIFGEPMLGTLYALSDDHVRAGDYLLAAQPAHWEFRRDSYEPFLAPTTSDPEARPYQLLLVAFHSLDEAGIEPTVVETLGKASAVQLPLSCTLLGLPSYEREGSDQRTDPGANEPSRRFSRLGERARRLTSAGAQSLIVLQVNEAEGYSGGGADFVGSWFLRASAAGLADAGCFQTEDRRSIAADWQPDGSRNHDEYEELWTLRVQPGAPRSGDGLPRLWFRSTSDGPARHRSAGFDASSARYRLAPLRSQRSSSGQ